MNESSAHTPSNSLPSIHTVRARTNAAASESVHTRAPFDDCADSYDRTFTETLLGTLLRNAVHEEIAGAFQPGDRVLDLGCGTGEDALRLARRGILVHAIDESSKMLRIARAKTRGLGVTLARGNLESASLRYDAGSFDGALSNFGAVNAVRDRRSLVGELGRLIRPGGRLFLIVMGRFCPWEWLWYMARAHPITALRRVRGSAVASTGSITYPSSAELADEFNGEFEHVRTSGIGVLLPPTYATTLVDRFPHLFRRAARLERRIRHSSVAATFNDHFLIELRRREPPVTRLFACPSCGELLQPGDRAGSLRCIREDKSYEKRNGVLDLLAETRARTFERFVTEYDEVRRAEGRGGPTPAYYRALPFKDATGRFARDWKIRAASYRTLIEKVVEPLERSKLVLRVLDLGAGSGWLSYRMSQRGHDAYAVDLRTDDLDGLGAHVHFDAAFTPVRAEFDRLPFADHSFDLVVFNASFHYSENYERTTAEALRVLTDKGRVVIVDSPMYRRGFSGSWMVAARERAFVRRYGFASNSLKSEHFLTRARLQAIAAETGVSWTIHKPRYGIRWALRPYIAKMRRRCEPAQFAVIEGAVRLNVEEDLRLARPRLLLRAGGRMYQRARRLVMEPHDEIRIVDVNGLRLEIERGVFDPRLYRSGALLTDVARRLNLDGRSVLDLGTGSGIGAIVAALRGARVTASDVSGSALDCATRNADAYQVDVDLRRSDLFNELRNERFDLILFNPPYFRGVPAGEADAAWRSPDVMDRFTRELSEHLTESGYALVVLSTDGACDDYLRALDRGGFHLARITRRRFANETQTVYRVAPKL